MSAVEPLTTTIAEADLEAIVGDPAMDDLDPEHLAHIVWTPKGVSAQAVVDAAKAQGTAVTALCGYRWVPRRNPDRHPVCKACLAVLDSIRAGRP
jgi:hypothetical protein